MKQTVIVFISYILFCSVQIEAQVAEKTFSRINNYFLQYENTEPDAVSAQVLSITPSIKQQKCTIRVADAFGMNAFTIKSVKKIYKHVRKNLPREMRKYDIKIITCGVEISTLCPEVNIGRSSLSGGWGSTDYKGMSWTCNISRPFTPQYGLNGRHIALWASHGRYYDIEKSRWKWQRPALFGTTEDLFTQSIVVPYLMPMLENAGANVFTPRERDWQTNEVIVDNDQASTSYREFPSDDYPWVKAPTKGFAMHSGTYKDGENPFTAGTARMNLTTDKQKKESVVRYQPMLPESGRYAVYVSYQTLKGSIDDAQYTVYHQGIPTTYHINQQMGGGTWVYLGSFDFDAGSSPRNCVIVSNLSEQDGLVTTDAIRFGGGYGNIEREGTTSQLPRAIEGARYYAQWAGAPYSVYSASHGSDDYKDDINVRSLMTNWLAGGSVYMPSNEGKGVPIELSLAIHSDAGYKASDSETVGSLAICTTDYNDGRLASGYSRQMSHDFSEALLDGIQRDICTKYPSWTIRGIWDRNYSETRLPGIPSTIVETMSHQNPADMYLGHDPNFKFDLARSIYKSILRFVSAQHGVSCVIQPLTPKCFRASHQSRGKLQLEWNSNPDPNEPTASATQYILYTAKNNDGFDNGTIVRDTTITIDMQPATLYKFKVTAANRGGESFPTPTLVASYLNDEAPNVLIVDAFSRLAPPEEIDNASQRGFDLDSDIGVSYGMAAQWLGCQKNFEASRGGKEGENALGYTDNAYMGQFIMGNRMDNAVTHGENIFDMKRFNITSCTLESLEQGKTFPDRNTVVVDMALGLQKCDTKSVVRYKTFNATVRSILSKYKSNGGNLLCSGAYIASDMTSSDEQAFLSDCLNIYGSGSYTTSLNNTINGMGTSFIITSQPNPYHYACQHADRLNPVANAFQAMLYADGTTAAVASETNHGNTFVMGFPLECITDRSMQKAITKGIFDFLVKK